jgi:hypothetical protein
MVERVGVGEMEAIFSRDWLTVQIMSSVACMR